MRQTAKRKGHSEIVEQRARKGATYRKTFERTLHQIDLALLVREMRDDAGVTQAELAKEIGTTQSIIARLEDAEYGWHSLTMLERIATACGVALKLHAEKKPNFDREVALVYSALSTAELRTAGMPMKPRKERKKTTTVGRRLLWCENSVTC